MLSSRGALVALGLVLGACGDDPVADDTASTRPRPSGDAGTGAGAGASSFEPVGGAAGQASGMGGADTTSAGGSAVGQAGSAGVAGAGGAADELVCEPAKCLAPSACTTAGLCCPPLSKGSFGDALAGARVTYALPESAALDIEMDFDTLPPTDPGKGVAMFLFFQATIGGSGALFGVQTDLLDDTKWVGRGALFSRLDNADPANAKVAAGGFSTTDPAAKVVGVRRTFPWGLGLFKLRLERDVGGGAAGHFFTLSMNSVGDPPTKIGSLRFPEVGGEAPRISAAVHTGILLYREATQYEDVPLWQVGLKLTADGAPPTSASFVDTSTSFLNADVYAKKGDAARSVVLAFGGKSRRCHPPGKLF